VIASITARGVICQETPHRSLHHPQALGVPPPARMASQSRSVSSWESVATWNENASVCLKAGPPLRPMQGMPSTVKSTVSTSPFLPLGKSDGARCTAFTSLSGNVAA